MSGHVIPSVDQCVGCENCKNVCKREAVSFVQNEEGFFYPKVDGAKCVNCGACTNVCPIYQDARKNQPSEEGYAAISKIKTFYKNGGSAGIFGTIANAFLNTHKNSLVVGAAYVDGLVQHLIIEKTDDIELLQNSKYVQSKLNDVAVLIKQALKDGKYVLFSGTPCQVNALILYVGDNCERLFTIDIICHGVPSPAMLDFDLKQQGFRSIQNVQFRKKKRVVRSRSLFFMTIKEKKGCNYILNSRDLYYTLFLKEYTYRETCYKCKFTNLSRISDITIGDCDSRDFFDFNQKDALNSVLINSKKGTLLWRMAIEDLKYCKLDVLKESECNHQLREPCKRNPVRDSIYKEFFNDYENLVKRYCKLRDLKERLILLKYGYLK